MVKSFTWFSESPSQLFTTLLSRKYKGYYIFAHNLSRFDITFFYYLKFINFFPFFIFKLIKF